MAAHSTRRDFLDFLRRQCSHVVEENAEGLVVHDEELGAIPVVATEAEWEEYRVGCAEWDTHPLSLMGIHLDEALANIHFRGLSHAGIVIDRGGFTWAQYVTVHQQARKVKREFHAYVNDSWFMRELGLDEEHGDIWVEGRRRIPLTGSDEQWVACARNYQGTEHSEYLLMLMALDELLDRSQNPVCVAVSGEGFAIPR
ncbi:hypothetical protein [Corynebacterium lowii]|uniref:Uncharacterized protein n=1 Tax=Corynebacterium lowii TaxID=1544413 RepID=A0A0N8W0B6_9CORY|nr:hypothetical protein [Corynebacterium lowii]KQB86242.1 hypothetical protein Clow_01597 [Corynebacterium lowii]MDP9852717.1 hypothetical protein [Corynebacterium lowii]